MEYIIENIERPRKDIVAKFRGYSTATIYEASGGKGAVDSKIKPLFSGIKLCGSALTAKCHARDNLMLHKAIALAKPGDVIVASVGGKCDAGMWGEICSLAAKMRRIEGLVLDGYVRDGLAIKRMDFPIFARGLSIKGTVKETLGSINLPIYCGNILVNPGDIVVGDDDGVAIVSREKAEEVLEKSEERERKEATIMEQIKAGKLTLEIYGFDRIFEKKE